MQIYVDCGSDSMTFTLNLLTPNILPNDWGWIAT